MENPTYIKLIIILLMLLIKVNCEIVIRKSSNPNTINKVSLTQLEYNQFLKYITDVPTISDFTFCIWMKSSNLTYSHPLLSYTRGENERLIRIWVNNRGRNINMALLEHDVFQIPIKLKENHWYHICPSWNSKQALWSLHINGKLIETGRYQKLKEISIPPNGEITVGQELTNINKELNDGIEGDIYGFNMVLAHAIIAKSIKDSNRRFYYMPSIQQPKQIYDVPTLKEYASDVPQVLSYFKPTTNRNAKGIMDIGKNILQSFYKMFEPSPATIRVTNNELSQITLQNPYPISVRQSNYKTILRPYGSLKRVYHAPVKNNIEGSIIKPLGLILIELSYNNCALGRGAPLNDEKVLISWTKTPVRVFGGAILKTVEPFCKANE